MALAVHFTLRADDGMVGRMPDAEASELPIDSNFLDVATPLCSLAP